MPSGKPQKNEPEPSDQEIGAIFDDLEAKSNVVGLYNLLYKIDRRTNPKLYDWYGHTRTAEDQSYNIGYGS